VRIFVDSLWRDPHAQQPAFDGTFTMPYEAHK